MSKIVTIKGYDLAFEARPLKRVILSRALLERKIRNSTDVKRRMEGNHIAFETVCWTADVPNQWFRAFDWKSKNLLFFAPGIENDLGF